MRVLVGCLVLLAIFQAGQSHSLPRERRQSSSSSVMAIDESNDNRAAIPGLSEIQTAIEVAQFLISVGQQVLPTILQNLTPPSGGGEGIRMNEMQLIRMVRQRMMANDEGS
ncbi:uncharacterized protein LOC134213130 [Armigeres subalbatus]|uniref:uncharacterized protein LOC134213130 n=1 Tax=Armigeres subalbatus TaxID=124917 RepID=UPI002ED28BBE